MKNTYAIGLALGAAALGFAVGKYSVFESSPEYIGSSKQSSVASATQDIRPASPSDLEELVHERVAIEESRDTNPVPVGETAQRSENSYDLEPLEDPSKFRREYAELLEGFDDGTIQFAPYVGFIEDCLERVDYAPTQIFDDLVEGLPLLLGEGIKGELSFYSPDAPDCNYEIRLQGPSIETHGPDARSKTLIRFWMGEEGEITHLNMNVAAAKIVIDSPLHHRIEKEGEIPNGGAYYIGDHNQPHIQRFISLHNSLDPRYPGLRVADPVLIEDSSFAWDNPYGSLQIVGLGETLSEISEKVKEKK